MKSVVTRPRGDARIFEITAKRPSVAGVRSRLSEEAKDRRGGIVAGTASSITELEGPPTPLTTIE